jgi:2-C-methyl-D-erythritol 2,4-cyclodiphosphate synthase
MKENRIGTGFDVHRFKEGTGMLICGIFVPAPFGVEAHSDGDVGLHALMDALLGAMGEGDIGVYFPPSDPQFKGMDSKELLRRIMLVVKKYKYRIINVDVTILCQQPKINPWRQQMKACVSSLLEVGEDRVGVKATTTEGLGFLGRVEGIAAQAVCLMERSEGD